MRKILLPMLLVALPAMAQTVYTYKDSEGNPVFTNEPPPAGVKVEDVVFPPLQRISSEPTQQNNINAITGVTTEQAPNISGVTLVGIPDGESLRQNNGTFPVTIALNASTRVLPSSYQFQILLDGKPYGSPQSSPSFTLTNIDRGTHTIVGQVLNNGVVVASSSTESFTLQRISTHSPARQNKPTPR